MELGTDKIESGTGSAKPAKKVVKKAAPKTVAPENNFVSAAPRSLPEFKNYKPIAGHPDWPAIDEAATELANEIRPLLEKPQTGAAKWRRRAKAYANAAKTYAINRKIAKQGREDLRPLYLLWTTLRSCNFLCDYCCDHQGNKYPDLSNKGMLNFDQAKQLLKVMKTRASGVYFAGGEPTLRKDLPQVTRTARDLDYYPIIINTNGSMFHKLLKKDAWKTWPADMDIIIVSLDALDIELLNKMWVTKKAHEVIINLLMLRKLAREMDFKLMVNVVIQPGRIAEAKAVIDFVNDLGIWLAPVPMNTAATINGALLDDPEYHALAETILERHKAGYPIIGSYRLNRRLLYAEKLTCRNTLKPHVDYDGRWVWPCKATVNVEPEYINVLDFEHVDEMMDYACSKIDPTHFHGPAKNQCGGNCNWAQNYSTDAYAHGLEHPLSLARDVFDFLKPGPRTP